MSIRAPIYNPEPFMQGDTWTLSLQVLDNNGAAKDLTGYTAKYMLKTKPGSTALLSLTSNPAAGIVITAATGTIALSVTSTQSAAFAFNKAKCHLTLSSNATPPVVQTLFHGEQEVYSRIAV